MPKDKLFEIEFTKKVTVRRYVRGSDVGEALKRMTTEAFEHTDRPRTGVFGEPVKRHYGRRSVRVREVVSDGHAIERRRRKS
jgi:hypothetical protein